MAIRRITYPNQYHDRLVKGMAESEGLSYSKAVQNCVESYFKNQSSETIKKYLTSSNYK